MEVLKLIMLLLICSCFPIFLSELFKYIKTKQKKKKPKLVYPSPQDVIDWNTINDSIMQQRPSWTSWTTTVSSSGEVF
jgi:hypothetical protein